MKSKYCKVLAQIGTHGAEGGGEESGVEEGGGEKGGGSQISTQMVIDLLLIYKGKIGA